MEKHLLAGPNTGILDFAFTHILVSNLLIFIHEHRWGPDDPATWVKEVCSRRLALNGWLDRVEQKRLLSGKNIRNLSNQSIFVPLSKYGSLLLFLCSGFSAPLRMSDLFRSRVLLNALRQESSRVAKKPIDDLKLVDIAKFNHDQLF